MSMTDCMPVHTEKLEFIETFPFEENEIPEPLDAELPPFPKEAVSVVSPGLALIVNVLVVKRDKTIPSLSV